MENNRGQSIFLSVVGIATLLVAIVGATFAYFSISVVGNETASSIKVTTAQVGGVTLDATSMGVNAVNVYPGWTVTKTFTIKTNSTTGADTDIDYTVALVTETSDKLLQGTDFVYTLTSSATAGTAGSVTTERQMPGAGETTLTNGTLVGGNCEHTYTLTVTFKEMSTDQNSQQGKEYNAKIKVNVATSEGMRTWDNDNNIWKPYSAS